VRQRGDHFRLAADGGAADARAAGWFHREAAV
jgi:hypothetical protein